jgi:hypothetical protein
MRQKFVKQIFTYELNIELNLSHAKKHYKCFLNNVFLATLNFVSVFFLKNFFCLVVCHLEISPKDSTMAPYHALSSFGKLSMSSVHLVVS